MAEDARPKLAQIPQGRDTSPHAVKSEDEEDDRRPKPLQFPSSGGSGSGNGNGNTVTLPSFREAYGPALGAFPPQPPPSHHDIGRPAPGPRPYPESPNSMSRPPASYTSPSPSGPPALSGPPNYRTSPHGHSHYGTAPPVQHGPPGPSSGPHGPSGHPGHPGPPLPGPPGHPGPPPPPGHERSDSYGRPHPPPDTSYQDTKEYYAYQQQQQQYAHYPDRPPPPGYWAHMPPNYQPAPPETAPRQRTSIACKYCRKRKIRCSGYQNTPDGKCTNCKKTGNDCVFQPVSSTTSTAFVPVSAIQGGVPPGTPLFGAFGQPLGPNGGRGPSNPPYPAYVPASPGRAGGYYHPHEQSGPHGPHGPPPPQHMQQPPPHPQHQPYPPHPQHAQHPPPPQHAQHPQHPQHMPPQQHQQHPPPPQHQQPPSHGPPPAMGPRHLPLPYPQPHPGYSGEDSRRLSMSKRTREDEDMEYPPRLRPPPPPPQHSAPANHGQDYSYYRGPEDARRSPPMAHGSGPGPAPGSAGSGSSIPPRGYGTPAPPALPQPPMSSVGTDTSGRSSSSFSGTDATSPVEWRGTSSPSEHTGDRTSHSGGCSPSYPPPGTRDFESSAGRELDRAMLKRLGSARPGSHIDYSAEQKASPLLREKA